ncbi:hypothetical protein ISS30_09535 [bacterium]|nr:hypothetical protein [bacterium]
MCPAKGEAFWEDCGNAQILVNCFAPTLLKVIPASPHTADAPGIALDYGADSGQAGMTNMGTVFDKAIMIQILIFIQLLTFNF